MPPSPADGAGVERVEEVLRPSRGRSRASVAVVLAEAEDRDDDREQHDQRTVADAQPGDQRRRAPRHAVVEPVAQPLAEPRLLAVPPTRRRRPLGLRPHRLRRALSYLQARACHLVPPCRRCSENRRARAAPGHRFRANSWTAGHAPACHDAPMRTSRARAATAAGFLDPGPDPAQPDHAAARLPGQVAPVRRHAVAGPADDDPAGRRRLGGRRDARQAPRQRPAAARRAGRSSASAVAVLCLAPTTAVFVAGMAGYGVGLGIVDASTNMQAVALEHRYGRPILPSFHGAWTLGGVIGAVIGLGDRRAVDRGHGARRHRPAGRGRFGPFLPRDHGPTELADRGRRALAPDHPGRHRDGALLHGRHRRADLGTALPRPHLQPPRSATSRSRRWPTCSPAEPSGSPATGWSRGSASSRCCGSARWSAPAGARRGRLLPHLADRRASASRSSAPASPWSPR